MGIDSFRSRPRVPGIAAVVALALSACTPDRSGEMQRLQGKLDECHAQLAGATAPVAPASAVPPPGEASPSATGVQGAIEAGFGNDLSSAALRRMLAPVLEKLVTTGVEGDLGRAPTDLYGWGDQLALKRGALLALVGNDGNRFMSIAENFVKVIQALPPAMQAKLAAEMVGFIGTFDIAFAKYPQYKGILAHHGLWRDAPGNGFTDPCAARGKGALHDQYQKFPAGVKRVIRMLATLEAQGMLLAKVNEGVGRVRVAFGL